MNHYGLDVYVRNPYFCKIFKYSAMKTIDNYISIVEGANKIAIKNFNNQDSIQRVSACKDKLLSELKSNAYIKIPFVGDFNAGKSSLLNSLMGVNILPTDVVPTTAVSYELYYSETEKLDIYHNGKFKETAPLSKISNLEVVPGDIVVVHINNDFIRQQNEKGIVLVDMPGIDSGIEAHNNAILNYIQEGSFFFLVSPAPQGTLRSVTLQFADELKKYNLKMAVVISKADQAPEDDLKSVIEHITDQAKRLIDENVDVCVTSSAEKNNADIVALLDKLDAEKFLKDKYYAEVEVYVNDIISELQLQAKLLLSNKEDYSKRIEELKREKENALNSLREKSNSAQSLQGSADDILMDVRMALTEKSLYLANILVQSNNDSNIFNAELLNIIRPVLVNSFKREITEYQNVIGSSVMDFSVTVNKILQDEDNKLLSGANEVIGNLLGKEVVEGFLKKGLDKLINQLVQYKGLSTLLKTLIKFVGPLTTILINIIPDILRLIFGKSKDQKIMAVQQKITGGMIDKLVEGLREPVEKILEDQRKAAYKEMESLIENEAHKFDDNIKKIQEEQQADEATITAKVQTLQVAIGELEVLLRK